MNHPTQGLEDMTLDLSTYNEAALKALAARIDEEKTKRERKVPFVVTAYGEKDFLESLTVYKSNDKNLVNLYQRLSAEAKLRAAGGGVIKGEIGYFIKLVEGKNEIDIYSTTFPAQGSIYFATPEQALSAYATLTPNEQAAIFGFGEE